MAEPLSIASGVVGVVVPALHGARLLLDDLTKITNAPEAVERLRGEVDSISTNLGLLRDIEEPTWTSLGVGIRDTSKATIESCELACNTTRGDVQRWTKRSKGGKLSWLDRVNVGFFRDQQLKAHSDRLQSHKLSLSSIVGTATLYSSIRSSRMTDDLHNAILSQQNCIAAASSATQSEVVSVQRTLAGMRSTSSADPAADDNDDLESTVVSLEELMGALKLSQALLRELVLKSQPAEVVKAVEDCRATSIQFGRNEGGLQVGINHGSVRWNGKE